MTKKLKKPNHIEFHNYFVHNFPLDLSELLQCSRSPMTRIAVMAV